MEERVTGLTKKLSQRKPIPTKPIPSTFRGRLIRDRHLYLMLLPVIGFYLLFKYTPMVGEMIAFKDYRFADGIFGSKWVGFKHFTSLFQSIDFWRVLRNTLLLNVS
ncbi:hypothetical protein [Paenibacillus alginolyticus]|uniref:hypothetical protein n=1 Tax=Paenibacillus alginolyticus TaxID=59839 RepID=UPI001FE8CC76|nr:hypothetical protein [Paenibacillus frigoriresistens]